MKHLGTKYIETSRLILRQFKMADAEAMYHNWASDTEVTKFLTWPAHQSVKVSEAVLKDWIEGYNNDDFYQWAIVPRANGDEPIGSISVVHGNDKIKMAHIGYCIGRKWWHQGIMSEALEAIIHFLIMEVGINRVESHHDLNNPNSGSVMKKCGMKYEGTMREADWNNQGICDFNEYAILAKEYKEKIHQLLN